MHRLNPTPEQYERLNRIIDAHTALKLRALAVLPHIEEDIRDAEALRYHDAIRHTPEFNECSGSCAALTVRAACQDVIEITRDRECAHPLPETRIVQQARSTGEYRQRILNEENHLVLDNWTDSPLEIVDYTLPQGKRETKAEITRNNRGEFWVRFDYEEIPITERLTDSDRESLLSMLNQHGIDTIREVLESLEVDEVIDVDLLDNTIL